MRALEELGLSGAYQVHVAPTVLRPDLRAHQVFLGFTDPSAIARTFPGASGWLVSGTVAAVEVTPDLKICGDLVIAANGTPIRSMAQLRNRIGLTRLGETVHLTIERHGEVKNLAAKVEPAEEEARSEKGRTSRQR